MTPQQNESNLFEHIFGTGNPLDRCAFCNAGKIIGEKLYYVEDLDKYLCGHCIKIHENEIEIEQVDVEPTKYGYPEDWKSAPGNRGKEK